MAETRPIQIFLCHASEDKAAVLDIYDRLRASGYKPWLDKKDLPPGQLWEEQIPKAIRASDLMLTFLSKNSIPKQGYVQTEFKLTLDAWTRVPQGMIHTIPARLASIPLDSGTLRSGSCQRGLLDASTADV